MFKSITNCVVVVHPGGIKTYVVAKLLMNRFVLRIAYCLTLSQNVNKKLFSQNAIVPKTSQLRSLPGDDSLSIFLFRNFGITNLGMEGDSHAAILVHRGNSFAGQSARTGTRHVTKLCWGPIFLSYQCSRRIKITVKCENVIFPSVN